MRLFLAVGLVALAACVSNPPVPCKECNGVCVDTKTDPSNCGACGTACAAGKLCVAGACKDNCPMGQTLCSGKCADTSSDPANCGTCGMACSTDQVCAASQCSLQCLTPLTVCGALCVDTSHDPSHCGDCGTSCAPANVLETACMNSKCTYTACAAGHSDCDSKRENGCEADTGSDVLNCGGCGEVCRPLNVMRTQITTADAGVADAGSSDAGSADAGVPDAGPPCGPLPDGGNAGPCPLQPPPAGATCINSECGYERCVPGFGDCDGVTANGCETNLGTDNNNCGGCRVACTGSNTCFNGVCAPAVLAQSYLSPGGLAAPFSGFTPPRPMSFAISIPPPSLLVYRTDGLPPVLNAPGTIVKAPPLVITDAGFAEVRWFAMLPDAGAREPFDHELRASLFTGPVHNLGSIFDQLFWNGTNNPILFVSPGAPVTGSLRQQTWGSDAQGYCPSCLIIPAVNMDGVGQLHCSSSYVGNPFPGFTEVVNFAFVAPMVPGVYELRGTQALALMCNMAGGGMPIGRLIVQ